MSLLFTSLPVSARRLSSEPSLALRLVQEINRVREAARLPRLNLDRRLQAAAEGYAEVMLRAENGTNHQLDGETPFDRVWAAGYPAARVAENLTASATADPPTLVAWWLRSAPHRNALLNPDVTDIGAGVTVSAEGTTFYCVKFARAER